MEVFAPAGLRLAQAWHGDDALGRAGVTWCTLLFETVGEG